MTSEFGEAISDIVHCVARIGRQLSICSCIASSLPFYGGTFSPGVVSLGSFVGFFKVCWRLGGWFPSSDAGLFLVDGSFSYHVVSLEGDE